MGHLVTEGEQVGQAGPYVPTCTSAQRHQGKRGGLVPGTDSALAPSSLPEGVIVGIGLPFFFFFLIEKERVMGKRENWPRKQQETRVWKKQ